MARTLLASLAMGTLALVLSLSGCGGDGAPAPQAGAAKKYKMAGIVFQQDQFFQLIQFGMKDQAALNNVDLVTGNSDGKSDKEFDLVQTYTNQNVDAILISPLSAKGSVAALKAAHDKGRVIITNNTSLAEDVADGDVECSNEDLGAQTGKAAAKYITDKLGGKATVAILAFKTQVAEQSDARTGGFKKQLEGMPNVKIVTEQDAWLSDMAVTKVTDILTAHPDVNIIYGANEGGTVGSVLAVRNAHKEGQIAVFGTDVSQQLIDFLKADDNVLQAITAQRPFEMGQRSVELALKALKKETFTKKVVLNGTCLMRSDPTGIATFEKQLKAWTAAGN